MLKKLIASTVLTAALALPAMAANTDTTAPAAPAEQNGTAPAQTTPGSPATTPPATTKPATPAVPSDAGKTNMPATTNGTTAPAGTAPAPADAMGEPMQASNIIGAEVMDSQGTSIGKIGDILLSAKGQVSSYVINVGGFLGIGDKPVALSTDQVTITSDQSGTLKVTTTMSKDALNAQPEYKAPQPKAMPPATPGAPAAPDAGTTAPTK